MTESKQSFNFSLVSSEANSHYREPEIPAPLSADKEAYQKDESCINCARKFNIPGISMSKRLICMFCYRGVCQNCLTHEYFHSETKRGEKMCSPCHHQLSVQAKSFHIQVNSYRLERAGLWKDISLASKQREILINQRQIAADELKSLQETISLVNLGKFQQLDEEKSKNFELQSKFNKMMNSVSDLDSKILLFNQEVKKIKDENEDLKKKLEKKNKLNKKLAEEINELKLRNSMLTQVKAEEVFDEGEIEAKVIRLNEEISEIMGKLDEKKELIDEMEKVLQESFALIRLNEANLEVIGQRMIEFKSNSSDLTEKEKEILQGLRFQIKQQDDLIAITEARNQELRMSVRSNGRQVKVSGKYVVSSELQPSVMSSEYTIVEKDQRKCQSCLLL